MKYIKISTSRSLLITTILLLGLSIQDPAAAGTFTTHKAKGANKSISEIPAKVFNRKPKQHDPSFAISPDEVFYKLEQKQKITLIDVRSSENYMRLHIPGSLNISLNAVKIKVFLKSFPIVLINEGFHYSSLQNECRQLTDLGFKAFILDGGLTAWKYKGGKLVGDMFALEDMQEVSSQCFFREKDYENTLVIDISPVQTKISRQLIPYSRHIPVSTDASKWFRKLNRIITDHKYQPFISLVVFDETGAGYSRTHKILAGAGVRAFYLQSGAAGYEQYLEDLMLSWLPQDSRIKTNRKCRTCVKKKKKNIITEIRK